MLQNKKIILTFIGHYLPGYKSGGPVRTVSNMLHALSDYHDFKIITRDRDRLDRKPYDGIKINHWNNVSNYLIFYKSTPSLFFGNSGIKGADRLSLRRIINTTDFDIYYLNSYFDFLFSIKIILLRKLKLIPNKPVIVASRGELSWGALNLKIIKKKCYLAISKLLKLYSDTIWHASSRYEEAEIKREFGKSAQVRIALDIPDFNLPKAKYRHKKEFGNLKILFISSIMPKKNLLFAIDILNDIEGDFTFDIYGPIKDQKYWNKCRNHISKKIKHKVIYNGMITHDMIHTVYPNYDLFFFPTLGENFGHVIYESLYFGTPVLCSSNTPWDKLETFRAGWNIELSNQSLFVKKINSLIQMTGDEFEKFVQGCGDYFNSLREEDIRKDNIDLFES